MLKDYNQNVDLDIRQADSLYRWQLSQPQPAKLNEMSCFMASVIESKTLSRDVYKALVKLGILDPLNGSDLDTTWIDSRFSHFMAKIPKYRQRKVVGLLFYWEEELTRWRLLDEEEAEIGKAMSIVGEDDEDCQMGLTAVAAKRKLLPSQREGPGAHTALPGYAEATRQGRQNSAPESSAASLASWPTDVELSGVANDYSDIRSHSR